MRQNHVRRCASIELQETNQKTTIAVENDAVIAAPTDTEATGGVTEPNEASPIEAPAVSDADAEISPVTGEIVVMDDVQQVDADACEPSPAADFPAPSIGDHMSTMGLRRLAALPVAPAAPDAPAAPAAPAAGKPKRSHSRKR